MKVNLTQDKRLNRVSVKILLGILLVIIHPYNMYADKGTFE